MSDDYASQSVGEYVREGTMLAVPLCFPGQTLPPAAGETAARAMVLDPIGTVYVGTYGKRGHVLAAMLRQDTGIVYDVGVVPEAASVDAFAIQGDHLYCVASGPGGTSLWRTGRISGKFMIQEWEIVRPPMEKIGAIEAAGVAGSVSAADGSSIFLVEAGSGDVLSIETRTGTLVRRFDTGGAGRFGCSLVLDVEGRLWGTSGKAGLWSLAPQTGALERLPQAVPCSAGREQHTQVSAWALDPVTGMLYGGTAPDGFLFKLDPATRETVSLGKPTRQEPISCLTVGHDGSVFGMAGGDDDIGHLFRYDPARGSVVDLGIPVSTLTARQYGYCFARACTGRDGEMYFGQCERVNHLWVYFPPIPLRNCCVPGFPARSLP
jgi:hypothetical protein